MPMMIFIFVIVLVDQLSKFYIQKTMTPGMSLPVVADLFHITYILNPGAAFGILENQRTLFILIAALLLISFVYYYPKLRSDRLSLKIGATLLVGGAAGNLIDRIQTGYVVDFIDFRIWPIFNVADMAIVGGVGVMICAMLFMDKARGEQNECK